MSELKLYKKKMGIFWWIKKMPHIRFIGRELTSLAVAFFAIELLLLVKSIMKGQAAYESFIDSLSSSAWIVINLVALGGLLFHSITWFNLAPKAMVVKLGDNKLPGALVALSNYVGWFVISGIIIWYLIQNQ